MSPVAPGEPVACPDHAKEPIRQIAATVASAGPKRAPALFGLPSHRAQSSKPARKARTIHKCPNWVFVSRTQATSPVGTGGAWPPILPATATSHAAPDTTASAKPLHRTAATLARSARRLTQPPMAPV